LFWIKDDDDEDEPSQESLEESKESIKLLETINE